MGGDAEAEGTRDGIIQTLNVVLPSYWKMMKFLAEPYLPPANQQL